MRYFAQSLACSQPATIRHYFWEHNNSKKDGGMSAIAFLFQNLFVAMTPSYDSILRRERYFNILSSPTITVSRAALCINIVSSKITIRGVQRMLDSDIASLFQVGAKQMNQQMKRNPDRFPVNFCFRFTKEEILRSQFATSSSWGGSRYLPYVYTEQGIIALAVSPRRSSVTGVSRTSRKIRAISG